MKTSIARCDSILKTLPIGFYAGRRIDLTMSKEAETSYYNPMEDKIVVSYPVIELRCDNIPATSTCTEEEAVRSMLYHEVAHAILTPANALCEPTPAINIFEDERIETVLEDFFIGVNFKEQLYDIHGGNAPTPTSVEGAFFNAVRFGLGTKDVQDEVVRMLEKYAPLYRNSERYGIPSVEDYEYDIRKLWEKIAKDFPKFPKAYQPHGAAGLGGKDHGKGCGEGEKEGKDKSKKSDNPTSGQGRPHHGSISPKELKKIVADSFSEKLSLSKNQIKEIANFQKSAEIIIGNFNKKNKSGSGLNGYSGVFNPRAVVRQDYRFFDRPTTTNGNNKFGTCHLNLIIDCSGSFSSNQEMTNGILQALTEIERKNPNFSLDVGFINSNFKLCKTKSERVLEACGGNDIPKNMKEILLKLQKPNTCNYNIVLFDGDALSNAHPHKDKKKAFSVFDMKQTTLITDPDNIEHGCKEFKSTKVVISRNYVAELTKNILRALTIAFG